MSMIGKILDYGKILLSKYEEDSLLKEFEKSHNEARSNQAAMRRRWDRIESYVEGRQIKDADGMLHDHMWGSEESETRSFDDQFIVVNDVLRVHLSNQQRLSSYAINPEVLPNDKSNTDDKNGARIGKIALNDFIRRMDQAKVKKRVARLIDLYGTVFLKTYFDSNAGRLIPRAKKNPETGEVYWDENDLMYEGEMKWKVVSPRNILIPKWTTDLSKCDWIEEMSIETIDWVYRNYGKQVKPETIRVDDTRLLGTSIGGGLMDNKSETETSISFAENRVMVKERYVRPNERFPQGAIFIWANGVILRSSTLTEFYDDLPYDSAEMIFDDKDVMGDTTLWHILPLQDSLNKTMTGMLRHILASAQLRGWMPEEANIDEKAIDNSTARWIKYSGKIKPDYDRPPELPETFFAYQNAVREFIMSHGFAQDISRRKGALSGNAIAALQEIDDTILKPTLESVESMLQAGAVKVLQGMARYYTNNRMVKMTGKSGWVYQKFRGEMLKGNFDASIKLMTGLPSNKNFRLEFLTKLQTLGIITTDEVRNHMEFGSDDELLEKIQKDNEIADRVVTQIQDADSYTFNQGLGRMSSKAIPHVWDNHDLIIKKLIQAMRENYDNWPKEVQAEAEWQLEFHQGALAANMAPPRDGLVHPDSLRGDQPPTSPATLESAKGIKAPKTAPAGSSAPEANITAQSYQNASQQPDRSMIPLPGVTGMQNVGETV